MGQRRCYTSSWYSLLPLILAVALLYGVSIPLGMWLFLRRKHAALDPVAFFSKYAFLTAKFKADLYGYEVALLLRKLVVVLSVCAFRSPTVKAMLVALILLGIILFHTVFPSLQPFVYPYHNTLDHVTMGLSVVLLFGGTVTSS